MRLFSFCCLFFSLNQVEKNDGLSEIICKKCLARLHIAYDFKKDAVTTNNELRSFLLKVNKDYQQLTAGGSAKSKNKSQNDSIQMDGVETDDELDENIEALIEEQEGQNVYKILADEVIADDSLTDDNDEKPPAVDDNNQELVDILGTSNGVVELQETQRTTRHLVAIAENANDEPPESVAVYFIEDDGEMVSNDSDYVPNEYSDENSGEMIADDLNEPQYLEYDENADRLYDAVSLFVCVLFTVVFLNDVFLSIFIETQQTSPKKEGTTQKQSRTSSNYNGDNRCDVCDKVFSTRTNLTRHRITHEGRKPYECKICGNSFTQNGSLKSHMV